MALDVLAMFNFCLGMLQNWRLTGPSLPSSVRRFPPDTLSLSQPYSDRPLSAFDQLPLLGAMSDHIGADSSSGDHYDDHGWREKGSSFFPSDEDATPTPLSTSVGGGD